MSPVLQVGCIQACKCIGALQGEAEDFLTVHLQISGEKGYWRRFGGIVEFFLTSQVLSES